VKQALLEEELLERLEAEDGMVQLEEELREVRELREEELQAEDGMVQLEELLEVREVALLPLVSRHPASLRYMASYCG
jgi:hypothetical protein